MEQSFIAYIENSIKNNWDLDALTDYKGATLQYKDVARKIEKLHIIFEESGIRKGDKIAVCGRNSSHWGVTFLATLTYGAVIVPILHEFKADNVHNIVNHSEARLLFVGDMVWENLNESAMPLLEGILMMNDFTLLVSRSQKLTHAREHLNELFGKKYPKNFRKEHVEYRKDQPEELAVINYTSGTTSYSKGVMLPYRSLWSNTKFGFEVLSLKPGDRIVSMLPMAHMYGLAFEFLYEFAVGCQIYFLTRMPSPKIIFQAFAEVKPNLVVAVPLIIEKIIKKNILPKLETPTMKLLLKVPIINDKIKATVREQMIQAFGGNFEEIIVGGAAFNQEVEQFLKMIDFPYTVGYGMTEFLVNRSYADQYNLIACAVGHHIYESRWLRRPEYLDQIIRTWYRGNGGNPMKKMMNFSSWNADAVFNRYLVSGDRAFTMDLLPDLEAEYRRWESTHRLPGGLYWQGDVQDGMEESISGGRRKQYARPTINSYMYGNAKALSALNKLAGNDDRATCYRLKADTLKQLVQEKLWNERHSFFETLRKDSSANVREAIGYIPWYFNLPDTGKYDVAWKEVMDEGGFSAPYGLTTAERRHPEFRTHGVGKCEWDGAIWPFASAQTLTAMANFMNRSAQSVLTDSIYFHQMERYVESQYHRGRPYIGEYLDEVTGYWLKGDQERSRYYNHSTFNDLIITGLVGLRPRADHTVEVNPLLPDGRWDWFCLDNLLYHGHYLTILWDKYGDRYHRGKGLLVLVDGKIVGQSDTLERIVCKDVLE